MGRHRLMFSLGLMVEMSRNLHIGFEPDLPRSLNVRKSLGLSNVCRFVAAVCVLPAGDREYLEHKVSQPHPQALPASSAGAAWLAEAQ